MSQKIPYYFAMSTIVIALAIVSWIGVQMFWPFKTVEVEQPYRLEETDVHAGSILRYTFDYCKFTDAEAHIIHQTRGHLAMRITGHVDFKIVKAALRIREGCGTVTKGVQLPANLPPGEYYLEEQVSYDVNPFQTIHHTFVTENFVVGK